MIWIILSFVGLFVGAFGSLIGASGSFILVPVLLFLYPLETPETITSISLTLSFFSALSGSIAYARLKRIDYRSGLAFTLTSVPGAVLGVYITRYLSRDVFQFIFGLVMLAAAACVIIRPVRKSSTNTGTFFYCIRTVTDKNGNVYTYGFFQPLGFAISFTVGVISGLLGIGGGIIHVPALCQILCFPMHVATATSQLTITITTFFAVLSHTVSGTFTQGLRRAILLSVMAIIGAQIGAKLSQGLSGKVISRILAGGMAIVALRMLIAAS